MDVILLVLHVALALGITGLVLLQKGKGAGEGAAFGGGASSVFGASGSSNFLSRATAILATAFFINSLVLAHLAANRDMADSVVDSLTAPVVVEEQAPIPVETVDESVPMPVDASSDEEVPLPE